MHFLSISENGHLAFTGRHYVHIFSTGYIGSKSTRLHIEGSGALTSLDLHKYTPESYTGPYDRIAATSCSISKDSKKLLVIDSEKNIYIFEKLEPEITARRSAASIIMNHRSVWYYFTSFRMDMKIIRGQFDKFGENLFLVDKQGNVLLSSTATPETIANPVQLSHHRAITLDLVQNKSGQMLFTCDGISSILYSVYGEENEKELEVNAIDITPPASRIANFALFKKDKYLLLAHRNGIVDLWDYHEEKHLQSWDIFHVNHGMAHQKAPEHEIQLLRLTEHYDHAYFAVKLTTYNVIPIFDLDLPIKKLRKLGQIRLDYDYSDFIWSRNVLYVYNPSHSSLMKKYIVSSIGVLCDPTFHITTVLGHLPDFESFVTYHNESIVSTDYFANESVPSWPGRKAIHELFRASTDNKIEHSLFTNTKKRVGKNRAISTSSMVGADNQPELDTDSLLTIPPYLFASENDADISNDESELAEEERMALAIALVATSFDQIGVGPSNTIPRFGTATLPLADTHQV